MKAAIVVFPGSNRENDAKAALTQAMGSEPVMVWHRDTSLPKVDLVLVPGGFSYGDYLRCGAIAANSPVLREVKARAEQGMAVIGVCNGFQIITEAGLLPGVLRAELIRERKARGEVLKRADLHHRRLFVGNSLRGLIPAELVE